MDEMDTLFLTGREMKLFDALPSAVKEGWTVERETMTVEETPENIRTRLSLLSLHDPKLRAFQKKAQSMNTPEELASLVSDTDLKDVSDADLAELFFALGPTALSSLIEHELQHATTDDDLDNVDALVTIRHSLLSSLR